MKNTRDNLRALILLQAIVVGDLPLILSQNSFNSSTPVHDTNTMWSAATRTASIIIEFSNQSKSLPALPHNTFEGSLSSRWQENYIDCWLFRLFQLPVMLVDDISIEPLLKAAHISATKDLLERCRAKSLHYTEEEVKILAPNRLAVLATIADDSKMLERALKGVKDCVMKTFLFIFVTQDTVLDPSKRPEVMTLLQVAAWSHSVTVFSRLLETQHYGPALICWDTEVSEVRRSQFGVLVHQKEGFPRDLKALGKHLQFNPAVARACTLHQAINRYRPGIECRQCQSDKSDPRLLQANQTTCLTRNRAVEMIRHILKEGANPNATAVDGHTPLFHAIQLNRLEIADVLIAAGADVNAVANNGKTCLQLAWSNGFRLMKNPRNKKLVRYLISKGAKDIAHDGGKTCLTQSLKLPSVENVRFLMELGLDPRQTDGSNVSAVEQNLRYLVTEAKPIAEGWRSYSGKLRQYLLIKKAFDVAVESVDKKEPFIWPTYQSDDEEIYAEVKTVVLALETRSEVLPHQNTRHDGPTQILTDTISSNNQKSLSDDTGSGTGSRPEEQSRPDSYSEDIEEALTEALPA